MRSSPKVPQQETDATEGLAGYRSLRESREWLELLAEQSFQAVVTSSRLPLSERLSVEI